MHYLPWEFNQLLVNAARLGNQGLIIAPQYMTSHLLDLKLTHENSLNK
jgi:hypothetical protein